MSFWSAVGKFFLEAGKAVVSYAVNNPVSFTLQSATLIVGVKGFMQARQMQAKGQDILANKTSAGGKLPVIYGTRRVGAQVIYMDVSANDSRDLYVVYALSVGECDEILGRTIELDGNPLTDTARFRDGGYIGSDRISSGSGSLNTASQNGTGVNAGAGQFGSNPSSRYRYVMNLHHGQATQLADPMLVASMPNWTSAHKLNGVCYIAAHYGYDKEGIWKGVPQLTVQVRGKKVFDPRDTNQTFGDVSTYKYSDNPALCFLNYITDNEVGKGLTQSQINMSTFTAAANVCDTQVDQPYFNGSAQSLTWSGNIGDDFITIGGTDPDSAWWQNKVGEVIDIRDGSNTLIVDGKEIKDVQRNGFYDQNNEYIVYINDTLGSTYSSQVGTSLVKVKRFHCNGYLDANKNVMDNAKELLANMRGIFLYIDGKYELSIEDTGSSIFSINDNHIISDAGISVDYGNKDKKANKVIVEFFNANKKYELDTATVLHDASPEYYSDDGDEILEIKAEFPYISDPYIAYNMGKAILTRSRNQTTMQFLGTPEMYKLNVGDIVDLTYAGLGFSGKVCRVEALELQPNGLVAVSLIEYFDVYTWEVPPQEPVEELANLPSAYAVKAPTGLSFTDTDSSSTGRPFLSWNEPTDFPDYQYRVNVVDSSGNQVINRIVDVENCDLNFVPTGSYVASVTSLNTLGTESNPARFPTTGTFTIGDAPAGTPDIKDEAITVDKLGDGSVTNVKVQNLSADKINTGELNLGQASGMAVRQTKTGYTSTATGFWLGNDGGTPKFNIGTSTNYLKFDGTDLDISGEISATTGEIGGFTIGTTSLTNTAADSKIQIGSGSDVFTVDGDGIYLGNTSFASAPFKALNTGEVQTTKSFTAGVAGSGEIAKMAGTGDYRFWSGNEAPANASFSVDKAGKVIAKNLVLKLTDGTVYFDSQTGFSNSALSQISLTTGTKVSTISNTFDADTEYEEITVTEDTDVNVSVSIDTNFGGSDSDFSYNPAVDGSENDIPDEFTLTIQHSSDGGSNYTNVLTDTFTRVNDRQNPKTTPAADEYKINTDTDILYLGDQGGIRILASTTTSLNLGCVDADGRTTLTTTGLTLTGISTGTTHRIKATVSTTDTSYDTTNNNVSSTAPRVISVTDPSGDGFYVGDGSGSTVAPSGDITRVQITTASNSGLTGGANFASGDALFSLALGSTFAGNKTFSNNVVIQGNLDVQGTTTTIDTTNLDVKDKNITLNYGTGDTSANANGAGFTIQDAVSAGNDASLTWTTANDTFNLSHPLSITGALTLNNTAISGVNQLAFNDPGVNEGIEWTGGNTKIFESPDNLTNAAGNLQVVWGGTRRLTVNNSGIDVNGHITASGNVTATAYYGDGSNLTGVTSTTINNNADNRIITGSGTANTLNAESGLTYNGSTLGVTGTISSGTITASDTSGSYGTAMNLTAGDTSVAVNSSKQIVMGFGSSSTVDYPHSIRTRHNSSQLTDNTIEFWLWNQGTDSSSTVGTQRALVLESSTGLDLLTGGYKVGGQEVISSGRNLTNIGTISSGAITSTELTVATTTGAVINLTDSGSHTWKLTTDNQDNFFKVKDGSSTTYLKVGTADSEFATNLNLTSGHGLKINGTEVISSARNLSNINLVKFRDEAASFYISPTNANTLNAQYGTTADSADMWINYRGYADGFTKFRDFRIGNGKGAALLHVDGSDSTFDFQSGSTLEMNGTTFIDANRNITVGNITSSGTLSVGSYFQAGTTVAAGFYQDSLNGAYRANGTTSTRGFYFQSNAGVSNTMYVGLVGTYAGRVGVGTTTPAEQFHATGVARVGSLKVGTATVFDTSRNMANLGNITSSGILDITTLHVRGDANTGYTESSLAGGISLWSTGASTSQIMFKPTSSGGLGNHGFCTATYNTYFVMDTTNRGWVFRNASTNTNVASISNNGGASFNNGIKINATTIVDASRNLINIGTIVSEEITNSGLYVNKGQVWSAVTQGTGVGSIHIDPNSNTNHTGGSITFGASDHSNGTLADAGIYIRSDGTYGTRMYLSTTDSYASGSKTAMSLDSVGHVDITRGVLKMAGTTVIDTSRNLSNIGTISSGAINSTGVVSMVSRAEIQGNGTWAYTRLKNSTSTMWDIAANPSDNSSALQFRPSGSGTNASLLSTSGNWTINGNISAEPIHIVGATGGDKLAYASNFEANGANIQLTLERSGSGWGGIGASGNNAFMVYSSDIGLRFGVTQAGSLLANGGTEFLTAARQIQNVTFADALYTDEYGKSLVGNFGQFQHHSAYNTGFNSSVAMWGWNYVQSNTNAPNTTSSQWYRNRVSLGDQYGYNYDSNDYWLEMAYPRYSSTSAGHMWTRVCEGGNVGGWSQVGSNIVGNFVATGNVTAYSDKRLKENIKTLDSKKALQMRGVSFVKDGVEGSGVIAQEIEEIAPELVMTADDEMGTKSVAYGNLVGYLIETVKDQQKQIDELKQRLDNGSS